LTPDVRERERRRLQIAYDEYGAKKGDNDRDGNLIEGLVRLAGGWWLRLIYCERKILLAGW
jgi:YD repeat-containing protein